jgi:anti-anti-sigma factor
MTKTNKPPDSRPLIYHHLGVWQHGKVIVVRFGDHQMLDELTVKKISEELYDIADRADCKHLVLDFSGVLGFSTLMLGKLLVLRKKMLSKEGRLVLCDLGPEVEDVIVAMKLDTIFEIMPSEADALIELTG